MRNELNGVNVWNVSCEEIWELVRWRDAKVVASLLILAFLCVAVVVGNTLVILAVFISTKLRTVTNLFIVSLAVADLMVGIAVLPFSATWEIFEIWIFGELWCSMWLAVDVWMCTASILNLCAISLDRYVAVTRPVSYPSLMSSKKAKLLIAAVWILSFIICFPPLVGWNDRKRTYFRQFPNNSLIIDDSARLNNDTQNSSISTPDLYYDEECTYTCELTNDKGYVLYSAIGSFFLPMFVMLFFYWRIYRAAVETTRAINQGFRTTKSSRLLGARFEEQRMTLRIHRGRSVQNHGPGHGHPPGSPNPISPNGRLPSSGRLSRSRSHERIKIQLTPPPKGKRSASFRPGRNANSFSSTTNGHRGPTVTAVVTAGTSNRKATTITTDKLYLPSNELLRGDGHRRLRKESDSEVSSPSPSPTLCVSAGRRREYDESLITCSETEESKPKLISKMGKRNIKAQVKRFRMETKAAKTLGIIVGGFIGCWCPFFTVYVIRAFCATCIPPLLFSVLFWLGYCNSAINPCIYALFSKDFRFAFKKIICRCVCQHEKKPQPQVVPIFLSSLGEDSDGNHDPEPSDSR